MTKNLYFGVPDLYQIYYDASLANGGSTFFLPDPMDYNPRKPIDRNLTGLHYKDVLNIVKIGGAFTLSEITDRIYDEERFKDYRSLKGRVKRTINYLEQEGYISFLPDRDNELTVCIYWYFYNIREN